MVCCRRRRCVTVHLIAKVVLRVGMLPAKSYLNVHSSVIDGCEMLNHLIIQSG